MNIVEAFDFAVLQCRRIRRKSWPPGRLVAYAEMSTAGAGAWEGDVIEPLLLLKDSVGTRPFTPCLADHLASDWEALS